MRKRMSNTQKDAFSVKHDKRYLRSLVKNIFTSEYDKDLSEMVDKSVHSSAHLLLFLSHHKKIQQYYDHAVLNLLLLLFKNNNGKLANFRTISNNYHRFYDIAEAAYKNDDHNTAWLMYYATSHPAVTRLHIKQLKKEIKYREIFQKAYGTISNNFDNHLRFILDFEPGYPIILRLSHEYQKLQHTGNLTPKAKSYLLHMRDAIEFYQETLGRPLGIQDIYTRDPYNDTLLSVLDTVGENMGANLFKISKLVK